MEEELRSEFTKRLKKAHKEAKEGRTYLFSCTHVKKASICFDCHVDDCRKWYRLGRKAGRKKASKP